MIIGAIVPINTGIIVCTTVYPELDLLYYGIKYFDIALNCERIIFIEKKQLAKLNFPTIQDTEILVVPNHLGDKSLSISPEV